MPKLTQQPYHDLALRAPVSFSSTIHPYRLDEPRPCSRRIQPPWYRSKLIPILIINCIAILALTLSMRDVCVLPASSHLDTSGYLCAPNGAPIAAARARGCEFDWISYHWLPRGRFTSEHLSLIRDFADLGPWQRYHDAAGTQPVTVKEAMTTTEAFLTRREHLHHCDFAMRQLYLLMSAGHDPPYNYRHVVHCMDTLIGAIYENPPLDIDNLTIHAVPFPEEPQIVG